jgi:hypothetical protein
MEWVNPNPDVELILGRVLHHVLKNQHFINLQKKLIIISFEKTLPYCNKYVQLRGPQMTAARIRPTQGGHKAEIHRRLPFFDPDQKYESWGRGHHGKTWTLGKVYSYNSDNNAL